MRTARLSLCLLCGLLVVALPSSGQLRRPTKKLGPHDRLATPQDYAALAQMPVAVGWLLAIDGAPEITLRVEFPAVVPRTPSTKAKPTSATRPPSVKAGTAAGKQLQGQMRLQQQALKYLARLQKISNPVQQRQQLDQLLAGLHDRQLALAQQHAQALAGRPVHVSTGSGSSRSAYRVVTASVQFQLPVVAKAKVAKALLQVRYDKDGEVLKYSSSELKQMRHPDMPGYKARFKDLQPNQLVQVYLGKARTSASKALDPAEQAEPADARPPVQMLLILSPETRSRKKSSSQSAE